MNDSSPTPISAGELAFRILAMPEGQWWVVCTHEADEDVAGPLSVALAAQGAGSIATIEGLPADYSAQGIVIAKSLREIPDEGWRALVVSRSRWLAGPTVVLVVDVAAWRDLARLAPDVASWLRGKVFQWQPEQDLFDADARLASLREQFGYTDEEVVRLAEAGRLPADPAFGEWVALVGRSDLLG